jgi:pyridoxamine 5'-phosphate oxidase
MISETDALNDQLKKQLYDARKSYKKGYLSEDNIAENPFSQFKQWYEEAEKSQLEEPNAMVIATVDKQGRPNTRTVLLKSFDEKGFVFFTNYTSQKAKEIEKNPNVSIQFLWLGLERQVKIRGKAKKIPLKDSMRYFFMRPKGSQIGAWVSHQSRVISSKALLVNEYRKIKDKFSNGDVPYPEFWGGYCVEADYFEFWQGGEDRLHDRLVFELDQNSWNMKRLSP